MLGRLFCSFWCQKYNVLVANTAGFLKCSLHAMLRILLPKKKKNLFLYFLFHRSVMKVFVKIKTSQSFQRKYIQYWDFPQYVLWSGLGDTYTSVWESQPPGCNRKWCHCFPACLVGISDARVLLSYWPPRLANRNSLSGASWGSSCSITPLQKTPEGR